MYEILLGKIVKQQINKRRLYVLLSPRQRSCEGSSATVRPSFRDIPVNTLRINILQWMLTKLGTYMLYLVLKRIWNPIDFQGHRSNVKITGSNV